MADRVGIVIELIGKDAAISGLQELDRLRNALNGKAVRIGVDTSGVRTAQGAMSNLFKTVGSVSKGIGSTLQSLGRGMTVSGMTLRRISNMFGGSILNKASYFAIGKAVNMVNQGLSNSVSRFDTFRTFPKLMQAIGYSAQDSENAIEKLNNAVLGLPTSLNEIIETSKPFIQLYGDINKGTDLAIAANNAFLANATDAASQANGLAQLEDLLTKGELTSTEWQSLMGSLGISTQYVAEQLGYSSDQMAEFRQQLVEGEIDANDFLDALIAAGTGTGKLAEMADISKDTMSAALENISTAFSNLGASVMESLDEIFQENTGEGLVGNIVKISDAIKQNVKPAVQGWISDNADSIIGFFQKLSEFNWGKLASSVVDNAGQILDFFGGIVDKVGEDNIIKFVSFAMTWASPLAKALQLFGRPISFMGSLFSKFGRLSQRIGNWLGRGGGLGGGGSSAGGSSGILQVFAFLGEIAAVGGLIAEFAKVAELVSNVKIDKEKFMNNMTVIGDMLGQGGLFSLLATTLGSLTSQYGFGGAALAGEGLTAGLEGLMAGVGGLIAEFAKVAEAVSSADLGNLDANLEKISSLMNWVALLVGVPTAGFGLLTGLTGGIGGLFAAIGEGLEGMYLENIKQAGERISQFVELANDISEANFPSEEKMQKLFQTIGSISGAFNADIAVDDEKVEGINKALDAIKQLSLSLWAFDMIAEADTDFEAAKNNITGIIEALAAISNGIADGFGDRTSWETGEQKDIIGNMSGVLENINSTIGIFEEIESSIGSIGLLGRQEETGTSTIAGVTTVNKEYVRDKFQKTIDQINEIVDGLQEVSHEITPSGAVLGALHEKLKTQIQDDIIKNYTDIMAQVNGLSAAIQNTDVSGTGVNDQYKRTDMTMFDKKREDIKQVIAGMKNIANMITSQSEGIPALSAAYEAWESKKSGETVENMVSMMTAIGDLMTGTETAIDAANHTPLYELPRFKDKIAQLTGALAEVMTDLNDSQYGNINLDWSAIPTKLENVSSAMESIKSIVTSITEMQEDLEGVLSRGRNGTSMSMLSEAMQGLTTAMGNLPENAEEIQERAENIKTAVDAVNSVITTLTGMSENIEALGGGEEGTAAQMGSIIQQIVDAISGGDIESAVASLQQVSQYISDLQTSIDGLSQVELSGFADQVSELYGELDTLKSSLDQVKSALDKVKSAADNAKSAIEGLADTAQSRASSFSTLISMMGSVAISMNGAASAANGLAAAINAIPTQKTVTVTYNQVGSPAAASVGGVLAATGGLIPQYRAGGGTIFALRPKGSDTVPAMLTPGEFVLRKKTVDAIGVPFLHALNSLNISAAIDRMMGGVRVPMGYGLVQNDNSRVYNNNAKVTQNIISNNPNYPLRIANRYARSL